MHSAPHDRSAVHKNQPCCSSSPPSFQIIIYVPTKKSFCNFQISPAKPAYQRSIHRPIGTCTQIRNIKFQFPPHRRLPNLEISNLKFQIILPPPFPLPSASPPLVRNVFARAPMLLPGMPSGRPCALAKTPARTRKHCNFSLSPPRTRESDNVHFPCPLSPLPIHRPLQSCFCLLNIFLTRP